MLGAFLCQRFPLGAAASGFRLGVSCQQRTPALLSPWLLTSPPPPAPLDRSAPRDSPVRSAGSTASARSDSWPGFRCCSSSSASASSARDLGDGAVHRSGEGEASPAAHAKQELVDFEYTGPFSAAVKRVKMLSVGSFGVTMLGAPILLYLQGDPSMTIGAKFGIAGTLSGFGAFTTGMLQWFASPYICHLKFNAATKTVTAETLSFFARPRITEFSLSEVKPTASLSPVSSFDAAGKTFYVDSDHFDDKALLSLLIPDTKAATETEQQIDD